MFEVGDCIINGSNGVCRVEEITTLQFDGIDKDKEYYVLQPLYLKKSRVFTPVGTEKVVNRKVVSKEEAKDLIDGIVDMDMEWIADDKARERNYKECMQTYDCVTWIKIIRMLYARKHELVGLGKKMTNMDERYLRMSEEYLFGELSTSLEVEKDKIEEMISERLHEIA